MDRIAGTDGLGGPGFTLDLLQELTLSNQNQAGVALRDDMVTLCLANPSVVLDSDASVVDVSGACTALANWDLHDNLDSTGVHVFREFLREANGGSNTRFLPSTLNYFFPFDISDPTNTPRGLDLANNDAALQFLGEAVKKLTSDGVALDARLGDLQSVTGNGERIEIHGGPEWTGVFNKVDARYAGADGYPEVTGSSSTWIMATELTDDGPIARGILTYSISTNPNSPHFSDQTKLYSEKQWVDLPFKKRDVKDAALSKMVVGEGVEDCKNGGWQDFTTLDFASKKDCKKYFKALRPNNNDDDD